MNAPKRNSSGMSLFPILSLLRARRLSMTRRKTEEKDRRTTTLSIDVIPNSLLK